MHKRLLISGLIVLTSTFAFSQEAELEGTRLTYRTEQAFGGLIHTQGYGATYYYAKRITGFRKKLFAAEYVTVKHPKEHKTYNNGYGSTKGFIYGKMNSVGMLRASYGRDVIKYSKEFLRGVNIGYNWRVGPTIALVKPVYLEVASRYDGSAKTEKYDPDRHSINMIYSKAPFVIGLGETRLNPGLHYRFALNFEFSPLDDKVKNLETGFVLDAFYKPIQIMAYAPKQQLFLNLFVSYSWGKKQF